MTKLEIFKRRSEMVYVEGQFSHFYIDTNGLKLYYV